MSMNSTQTAPATSTDTMVEAPRVTWSLFFYKGKHRMTHAEQAEAKAARRAAADSDNPYEGRRRRLI